MFTVNNHYISLRVFFIFTFAVFACPIKLSLEPFFSNAGQYLLCVTQSDHINTAVLLTLLLFLAFIFLLFLLVFSPSLACVVRLTYAISTLSNASKFRLSAVQSWQQSIGELNGSLIAQSTK